MDSLKSKLKSVDDSYWEIDRDDLMCRMAYKHQHLNLRTRQFLVRRVISLSNKQRYDIIQLDLNNMLAQSRPRSRGTEKDHLGICFLECKTDSW